MNKIISGIILSIIPLIIGCSYEDFNPTDWAVDPILEFSESGLVFNAATNCDTIKVTTNYQTFLVSCPDSWCKITPNSENSIIIIEVEPNMKAEQRRTSISVTVGRGNKSLTKTFSVVQMGGYWDVIGQFSVYWSSDVTTTQKETISEILTNMKYVQGGTFNMGTSIYPDLTPPHNVTLSDFYINKFEVTQKQWNSIMGSNQSLFKGENLPVENIKWEDALDFVTHLSSLTNLNFSLPTEAQWEYAARGGRKSMGFRYPGSDDPNDVAIYKGYPLNLDDPYYTTYEGGLLLDNELELHDMAGNVSELCLDWYGEYELTDQINPTGPATGKYHVVRGGDISMYLYMCNSFIRLPSNGGELTGIRLCIR